MEENNAVVKSDYMKMMPMQDAAANYEQFKEFVKSQMKADLDYGVIPGTPKPTLYKPGAEKLRFIYAIGVEMECIEAITNLDTKYVDYTYKAIAKSPSGQVLAECEGNCNSEEAKFGYAWKQEHEIPAGVDKASLMNKTTGKKLSEFQFALDKKETSGQYGKPAEYWKMWDDAIASGRAKSIQKKTKTERTFPAWELDETVTVYRVKNPEVVGMKNTIMKMAQKRAFVGAILLATGASEYFTQDIEDMDLTGKGDIFSDGNTSTGITDLEFTDIPGATAPPAEPVQRVPGHWYAKLEKCKTPEEVDDLALKNKETIQANPELRKTFNEFKAAMKARLAKEQK